MRAIGQTWVRMAIATMIGAMGVTSGGTNPLPVTPCLEGIHVTVAESTGTLVASFTGTFYFTPHLPDEITTMTFPLPPDAQITQVVLNGSPVSWNWIPGAFYPTQVPEQPLLPMIGWDVPPGSGLVSLHVEYSHALIRRGHGYIFLYALGTGKYSRNYDVPTEAKFEIELPPGYGIGSVSLDDDPWPWSVDQGKLQVDVYTEEHPETRDLIVRLAPQHSLTGWLAR